MSMYVMAILATTILYATLSYVSYISVFVIVQGFKFRLIIPLAKALSFIIFCYISIITDVVLFVLPKTPIIVVKNFFLLALLLFSLVSVRIWKGAFYI